MAKDTLRLDSDANGKTGQDQRKDTGGGTSAKGYAEHEVNGSDYNRYGNRIDFKKLAATNFR